MTAKANRRTDTRGLILSTAERLFAEHGVATVSNRQVSEVAGQGNNFAVGYHFGNKAGLIREIVRKHAEPMERVRLTMLAEVSGSSELRDWVSCLIRPVTGHLDALGSPSWYARFTAQVMTDPTLWPIAVEEALTAHSMRQTLKGLIRCCPTLPDEVRAERSDMTRHVLLLVCAERERALAEGSPTPRSTWDDTATGMINAIVGLWLAPAAGQPSGVTANPVL
ncbi:MAG: TetR/AcrR family transcriptional regulator [Kibdelosporangium sp.]